jgi:hypothetical protein
VLARQQARHAALLAALERGDGFGEGGGRELAALSAILDQVAEVAQLTVIDVK